MREGWQETRIGEVASVVSERVDPTSLENGIYVGLEHLASNARSLSEWGSTSDVSSSTTPFLPGDTLFGRLRPYLRKGVVAPVAGVCSPEILVLRGQEGIDPRFLGLLVLHDAVFEECNRLSAGSRMPRTSAKDLLGLSVLMPPLAEQRRIVDLVGSIDRCVDSLQTQVDATREARSALLAELLAKPGNDWQATTLGEVAHYQNGFPFKPEHLAGSALPVIRIRQLLDEAEAPDRTDIAVPERHRIDDGDIVFSWSATLAVRIWNRGPAALNQHLFKVLAKPQVEPDWLALALDASISDLAGKAHGTTMKHITKRALSAHAISLPPRREQLRIADLVGSFDKQIASLESQIDSVQFFRAGVLSELLSGERLLEESYDMAVSL